jgi:hypothetical protein
MSLLSDRQREDLCVHQLFESQTLNDTFHNYRHKSMLDYLHANNFIAAFNALKSDAGTEYTPDPKAKYAGLLEKKWTSVIRLQKKVSALAQLKWNEIETDVKLLCSCRLRSWIWRTVMQPYKRSYLYHLQSAPPPRVTGFLGHQQRTFSLGIDLP